MAEIILSLKPTAVASGSEQIAQTERAVELASPRMVAPSKRVKVALVIPETPARRVKEKELPPWLK